MNEEGSEQFDSTHLRAPVDIGDASSLAHPLILPRAQQSHSSTIRVCSLIRGADGVVAQIIVRIGESALHHLGGAVEEVQEGR